MARITSLNMLLDPTGKEFLAELYGKVIDNVQKNTISNVLKNRDLSGNPTSGTVEAKRFANAKSKSYGTARAAGAGDGVKAKPVTVPVNIDREIVEEIEQKDISLYGVEGLLNLRSGNHQKTMIRELERAFFAEAVAAGVSFTPAAISANEILEELIQQIETTQNDYVDGVDRDMISVIMSTTEYGKIRNFLDTGVNNSNIETNIADFGVFHGVRVYPSVYLPANAKQIAMIDGAVAQPVLPMPYDAREIPLSKAIGVALFYSYGTKAVTSDLIQYIS